MNKSYMKAIRTYAFDPDCYLSNSSGKFFRHKILTLDNLDDVSMWDCGYTKLKLNQLIKQYLHHESRDEALRLWDIIKKRGKYSSVSFHTYNHYQKEIRSYLSSIMGPCLLSVSISYFAKAPPEVTCYYRTTELLKKFPADMVFIRDILLPPFELPEDTVYKFYFNSLSFYSMYMITPLPHFKSPVGFLKRLKVKDGKFHHGACKYLSRYFFIEEEEKFCQARKAKEGAYAIFTTDQIETIKNYLTGEGYADRFNK